MKYLITIIQRPFKWWNSKLTSVGLNIWAVKALCILILIALFADLLANEMPLIMLKNGAWHFPIFNQYLVELGWSSWDQELLNIEWKNISYSFAIWPPIPYLPENIDILHSKYLPPFSLGNSPIWHDFHLLGTDGLGRDVLSGLIHGSRTALMAGLFSMSIAAVIGVTAGALAGYYGDTKAQITRISFVLILVSLIPAWFYSFEMRKYILADSLNQGGWGGMFQLILSACLFFFIIAFMVLIGYLLRNKLSGGRMKLPIDLIVSRFIEVFDNIPVLFLIISISAIAKPGLEWVILVIGLTSWTSMARFTRSEILKIRELNYIESAKALGYSDWRTLFKHAIPNASGPILVTFAFGASAAILIEASLSFLGVGVPIENISWGSMLAQARKSSSAWWLAVFPGLGIFFTVWIYNLIGEHISASRKKADQL